MNEKFNKNVKVEQLTKMFLGRGEEKGLIVKDPLCVLHFDSAPPVGYMKSVTLRNSWKNL